MNCFGVKQPLFLLIIESSARDGQPIRAGARLSVVRQRTKYSVKLTSRLGTAWLRRQGHMPEINMWRYRQGSLIQVWSFLLEPLTSRLRKNYGAPERPLFLRHTHSLDTGWRNPCCGRTSQVFWMWRRHSGN